MGGMDQWVSDITNSAIGSLSLGMVNPGRDKTFSSGVFGGGKGASAWAEDLLDSHAFGMAASSVDKEDAKTAAVYAKGDDARRRAELARLAAEPRPQTPGAEAAARRRAAQASEKLGGGRRRRASETLTTPGALLSGSLPESYGF